jgi:predicted transposase YdaD
LSAHPALPARLPGVELPVMTELSEVKAMLSERVKEWTEQWKQQGLQEGRQEEREASRQREAGLILRQIQRRIGVIPTALASRVRELPLERIESLGEALLDFSTPQDLETWLSRH